MKINSVNNIRPSFKGIVAIKPEAPQDVFGDKKELYKTISDAKSVDIWVLEYSYGCMYHPKMDYKLMIQDQKDGSILKEFQCKSDQASLQKIQRKLEQSLAVLKAHKNNDAISVLKKSAYAKQNPDEARAIEKTLVKESMSRESDSWRAKLDCI